jgi:hypothetical protein
MNEHASLTSPARPEQGVVDQGHDGRVQAVAGNPRPLCRGVGPQVGSVLERGSAIGGRTVVDWRAIQRLIAGVDAFLRKEALLVEDVEQGEAW